MKFMNKFFIIFVIAIMFLSSGYPAIGAGLSLNNMPEYGKNLYNLSIDASVINFVLGSRLVSYKITDKWKIKIVYRKGEYLAYCVKNLW